MAAAAAAAAAAVSIRASHTSFYISCTCGTAPTIIAFRALPNFEEETAAPSIISHSSALIAPLPSSASTCTTSWFSTVLPRSVITGDDACQHNATATGSQDGWCEQGYGSNNGTRYGTAPPCRPFHARTPPPKNDRHKTSQNHFLHLHFEVRKVQVRCLTTAYIARDAFVCLGHGDCPVFASACESGEQINPSVRCLFITFIHSRSFASSKG